MDDKEVQSYDNKGPGHLEHALGDGNIEISKTNVAEAKEALFSDELASPAQIIRENWKTFFIVVGVQLNGAIMGLEYVLLGALVGVQAFCKTMGHYDAVDKDYAVRAWTLSLWAGLFGLTQFTGQLFAGWFTDRFGRKPAMYFFLVNIFLGVMTEILSQNYADYTGAKILMGNATGMMQVIVPTYVAEITPREIRGITVGMFSFFLTFGSLIGTFVTWGADKAYGANVDDNRGWRVPLYVGLAVPSITLTFALLFVPESPYWLILKNRVADSRKSLEKLHPGKSADQIERILHELEFTVLKEREHQESTKNASYIECVTGPNLARTFCALWPSLVQQLIGNQLVQSYSTYFFGIAGLSDALTGSVIVSCIGLIGAAVAFVLIEKKSVGRWSLVFWGTIGMTLSMLGVGITDSAVHGKTTTAGGSAYVAFIALFNFAAGVGPGVAGWAYAGESGSARLRAKTATLATGSNAVIGTVTNIVIPLELTAIGPNTGYMFAGIGVICTVLVYLYVPDVTGRSYAQLDELFERRIPARQFAKTECTGNYGHNIEQEVL